MQNGNRHVALVLDSTDNVAILLSDISDGAVITLKGSEGKIRAAGSIETGHKIAIAEIHAGNDIIKYGQRIGRATVDIEPGEWVHLHNMESAYDIDFRKRVE